MLEFERVQTNLAYGHPEQHPLDPVGIERRRLGRQVPVKQSAPFHGDLACAEDPFEPAPVCHLILVSRHLMIVSTAATLS